MRCGVVWVWKSLERMGLRCTDDQEKKNDIFFFVTKRVYVCMLGEYGG